MKYFHAFLLGMFFSISTLFLYSCDLFIICPENTSWISWDACRDYCGSSCSASHHTETINGVIVVDECQCY